MNVLSPASAISGALLLAASALAQAQSGTITPDRPRSAPVPLPETVLKPVAGPAADSTWDRPLMATPSPRTTPGAAAPRQQPQPLPR